jgi:hypothetical protein
VTNSARPHRVRIPFPVLGAAACLLATGCAEGTPAAGWLDRVLPPAEARQADEPVLAYPNLASVPARPAMATRAARGADQAALEQQRADAEARRDALAAGTLAPAATPGRVGTVLPDSSGRFSTTDEGVLRRAVALAGGAAGTGRLRLSGPADAALATADRLARLGLPRARIGLEPAPTAGTGVEILVASGPSGR